MTLPTRTAAAAFVLTAALALGGCDRDSTKPKEPKVDATPAKPALPSADQIKADAAKALEKGQAAAASAAEKVKASAPAVVDQAKETTASGADAAKVAAANAQANAVAAAEAAKAQGTEWMTKLDTAIKENKLDQAQTYVDALDKIKTNLPENLRTQYESLKTNFQAAKAKVTGAPPAPPAELNK